MQRIEWARDLARSLLAKPLPRRWSHTQGVAAKAETLRSMLDADAESVIQAAWLHDIGYAPDLAATGFHPLDGARYLRNHEHAEPVLCELVAHHSCALIEADERGLADVLSSEFPLNCADLVQALTYCDMTTDPDGNPVRVADRLAEIRNRYQDDGPVARFIRRADKELTSAVVATWRNISDNSC